MALRKTPFISNEYYHIYNRGNSKQPIFQDENDYIRFIKLLFLSNGKESFKIDFIENEIYDFDRGEQLVSIGAYCLMPNHFHLLLTQVCEGGISKFMQKLSTGYSMFYNNRYERTGSLFEGKFKSEHADNDRYLKYLFSYIHLNPVKLIDSDWKEKGIKNKNATINFLEKYPYSSFQDFTGYSRQQKDILNIKAFPSYFQTATIFKDDIFNWLSYRQDL